LGGRSPEHDVSVITGLQALKALDQDRFSGFPVYVTPRGGWLVLRLEHGHRSVAELARRRGQRDLGSVGFGTSAA